MTRILSIAIARDTDIILARQRTRRLAQLLGFDAQDATRITTSVSELVRNALEYAKGGRVEFTLKQGQPQALEIVVSDNGPGIKHIKDVLEGRYQSVAGMGIGITGARRLMDDFAIETSPAGTKVSLSKTLPKRARAITTRMLGTVTAELMKDDGLDPVAEIRRQNQDTLLQFQELRAKQEELQELNQELQDTNRGVVALYAELDERADHLRRADQLKSRFLSNMSHEFRTPLNSILSLSRMLLNRIDGELTSEQEKQVQFIRKAAENLTEIVNDLLDLARIEAGKTVVTPKEFSIDDLFGALRGMLRPLLVGDAVNLVFDDASFPVLYTDEGKVSQILRNFISNAIKFTERGEIRIGAELDAENDQITFRVSDTGVGIAPDDIGRIWEEFSQIANRLQGRTKGTGLGLPLSKRFAVLLGGDVSVTSTPGNGSVFSLTIPRRFKSAESAAIATEWEVEPGRLPVLVLEDNAADAFTIERALSRSHYQAIPVRTIAEARRAVEAVKPAALILDIILEAEDTWGLLLELKRTEATRDLPVIVASTTDEDHKAMNFGADGYLAKPVDPAALMATLDKATGGASITKVLLVDDEEVSRYLVRQLLPRGAYQLVEAVTGREGLRLLDEDSPDIVLFDLNMPEMTGFEFLDRIRTRTDVPPAIAITSMVLTDDHRRRLLGAAGIVSKFDITSETLTSAIEDVIDRNRKPYAA